MLTSILLGLTMLSTQPATGPVAKVMSPAEAITTIDRFLADPKIGADAKAIMDFAQESDACQIALDEKVVPWMQQKPPPAMGDVLMIAFVAGDIRAQLENHKAEDQPYAGFKSLISAYEKLQATNKDLKIAEVDAFVAMEKKGELKGHADKIAKEREK